MSGPAAETSVGRRRPSALLILVLAALVGIVAGAVLQRLSPAGEALARMSEEEELAEVGALPRHVRAAGAERPPSMAADLPIYPGGRPLSMGDRSRVRNVELQMAWFTTPDPVDAVLDWYEEVLVEAGIRPLSGALPGGASYVGYEDPETGDMHTATVIDFGGETLVLPALGRLSSPFPQGPEAMPSELPHPPSAESTAVMSFSEMGSMQYSISARSSEGTGELKEFYRTELASRGWEVREAVTMMPGTTRISARKERLNVQVILMRDELDGYPVTQISIQMTRRA